MRAPNQISKTISSSPQKVPLGSQFLAFWGSKDWHKRFFSKQKLGKLGKTSFICSNWCIFGRTGNLNFPEDKASRANPEVDHQITISQNIPIVCHRKSMGSVILKNRENSLKLKTWCTGMNLTQRDCCNFHGIACMMLPALRRHQVASNPVRVQQIKRIYQTVLQKRCRCSSQG